MLVGPSSGFGERAGKKNPASTAERGSNRVNMTWELCGRPVYSKHNMALTALQAKSDRLRLRLWA